MFIRLVRSLYLEMEYIKRLIWGCRAILIAGPIINPKIQKKGQSGRAHFITFGSVFNGVYSPSISLFV